jgi:hypothetical protein
MSLTVCIKKAGAALSEKDKAAILAKAGEYRRAGMATNEAAIKAVDEQLAEVRAELAKALAGQAAAPITWELRDTGTLAIKGNPDEIKSKLADAGITKTMVMHGGIMVGKTHAAKAQAALEGKAQEATTAKPLSVGTTPADVEPVTVKDGIVHIGKHEAIDFDSGEPVKVRAGASDEEIKQALKDAGALGKRQKFFGGNKESTPAAKTDLLGEAPNDSQQAASKLKGERAEREQRQQAQAPDAGDFKLAGSDRAADANPDQEGLFARGGVTPEQRAENFKRWSNNAPLVTSAAAKEYPFKSGQKVVLEGYHGAKRPDRIGSVFQRKRATSGPMAFFTSEPELASSYAKGKEDTSLANEDQHYATWFKFKPKGERSPVDIERAWYRLPEEAKAKIAELAPRVMTDDTGEHIILGPVGETRGNGGYHVEATRTTYDRRGNPLKALVEAWLDSGALYDSEHDFLKVLELAGFPVKDVTYDSPHAEYPAVYKTFIAMQKPLVTSDIPQAVRDALNAAAKRDRSRAQPSGSDMWNKNTRTLREWVDNFNDPANDNNSYVWTSIPDKVTEVFKSLGYDGIIDWSGKGGGHQHPVYIPFEETQVKSATGNKGTFDGDKKDFALARDAQDGQLKRSSEPLAGRLTRDQAQSLIDKATKNWKGAPKIRVVDSPDQFPIAAPDDARGLFYRGEVWVAANAHRAGPTAQRMLLLTVAHEVVGHYGTRQALGADFDRFLKQIELAAKSGNKAIAAIRDAVDAIYVDEAGKPNLNERQRSDEIAARVVENAIDQDGNFKPGFGFVKAVYSKIAQWLRDHGINIDFTHAELQGILVRALRHVEQGPAKEQGQPAYAFSKGKPNENTLKALSEVDELFQLPKSDKTDIEGIARDNDPNLKVAKVPSPIGGRKEWQVTFPDGQKATITLRPHDPNVEAHYDMTIADGDANRVGVERPGKGGENVKKDDVWLDASKMTTGKKGAVLYNIAATFAHNTGRIFIGDPAGLSNAALRRRTEHMLSSALKFGTTEHLAPHLRQTLGDAKLGIPPCGGRMGTTSVTSSP